ncbi:MAG TPA: hypothetical protein VFT79_09515 [Solirubrobacterales bacterium]|nr:hypothetical protein [Solirubrobacterales bacterium]
MNEQEQIDLAKRIADVSDVLDFETAFKIVRFDPARAEELIRNREEEKRWKEEFARVREGRRRALLELR